MNASMQRRMQFFGVVRHGRRWKESDHSEHVAMLVKEEAFVMEQRKLIDHTKDYMATDI